MSHLLKGKAIISSLDYRDVLSNVAECDLVYMDPPYQGVCGDHDSRYFSGVIYDDFVSSLAEMNNRNIPFVVSYDGRTGKKKFGENLPDYLNLTRIEVEVGRSSQATLLGRQEVTYESLYISSALIELTDKQLYNNRRSRHDQLRLFEAEGKYEKSSKRIS